MKKGLRVFLAGAAFVMPALSAHATGPSFSLATAPRCAGIFADLPIAESVIHTTEDGLRVLYRTSGSKSPKARILFLNGIDKDMSEWSGLRSTMEKRYPEAAFVQVDLIGQGKSAEMNSSASEIHFSLQVRVLKDLIEKNGWDQEPLIVVGHSYGGGIAARLNAEHPGRIQEIILAAPFADFLETKQPGIGPFLMAQKMAMDAWGLGPWYEMMVSTTTESGMAATWLPYSTMKQSKSTLKNVIAMTRGIRQLNMDQAVANPGDARISIIAFTHDEVVPPHALMSMWNRIPEANRGQFRLMMGTHEAPQWLPEAVGREIWPVLDGVFQN